MNKYYRCAPMLAPVLLGLVATVAHSDDKVPITILNDGTDDIVVSLRDMNTNPHSKLLSHQRINGFAKIPISVSADASGNAHVYWSAVTADPSLRRCGRRDKPGLASEATVHVSANHECSSP